jgi:ABC-2 type transport system permease protein
VTALAILGKELRTYFTSMRAYVVGAVFLVVSGYYFYTNLAFFVLMGGMDLPRGLWQYQFHDTRLMLLVVTAFLTMRLFAEERKLGTLELLWTYPVSDVAVIAGKYAASLVVVVVLLALTALYPLSIAPLYPVAAGPLVAGYIGLLLLAAAFAAVGLWASALTDSQVVAGILTFGMLLLFWILTWNQAAASDWVIALLMPISLFDRFYTFARGAIDLDDVVFLLGFSFLFLALTLFTLESRRWRGLR